MNIYKKNILIILLAISGFIVSIAYGYFFRNFINQPSFQTKDLEYKMLSNGIESDKYTVSPLFKNVNGANRSRPYYFPERKNIVFSNNNKDKRELKFYKIDSLGNLKDSITFSKNYSTCIFGAYILQNTKFFSWIINGDTLKKDYVEVNPKADWDQKKVDQEFSHLNEKAESVYYFQADRLWNYDDPKRKNKIDKAVFLIDRKWYALYGKNLYVNLDDLPTNQLNNLVPSSSDLDKPNPNIHVVDFQKINQVGKNKWDGFAYLKLFYKTDTIKIKTKLSQNEKPKNGDGRYAPYNIEYYKPNGLPYAFIVQDNVCYIIKNKK